eukprot:3963217-Pleurochrysis_carterae.AAC.1
MSTPCTSPLRSSTSIPFTTYADGTDRRAVEAVTHQAARTEARVGARTEARAWRAHGACESVNAAEGSLRTQEIERSAEQDLDPAHHKRQQAETEMGYGA